MGEGVGLREILFRSLPSRDQGAAVTKTIRLVLGDQLNPPAQLVQRAARRRGHYDRKLREGERACPYRSPYWNFFVRHTKRLSTNPRLGLVYRQIEKMGVPAVRSLRARADLLRGSLNSL